MTRKTLFFDIETFSADERWNMTPREFFRLGQYAWGREGEVTLTEDYDEMLARIREADLVVGHNIHAFDLSVMFGKDSIEPLQMAMDRRVFDTFVHASLVMPAPDKYTARNGHTYVDASRPANAMRWLGLDNLSFQLGLPGKISDLKALAKKYGGFGEIPLDDEEFRTYAEQDVHAVRDLAVALLDKGRDWLKWDYAWREQLNAAIDAQNSRNGFRVDAERAQARVDELNAERDRIMAYLVERYDFPTEGKKPWMSSAGKEAILNALAEHGISPKADPNWPKTKTGAPTLGGDALIAGTEGTPAEELGRGLATLAGQRSLAQLALDSMQDDGYAHPEITTLQRSGRKCLPVTHKLLTNRGVLDWTEIRVGDYTLDHRNNWVRVLDVHFYEEAPVHRFQHRGVLLESTPEHKWVQRSESASVWDRALEPINPDARKVIQLTPDSYPFDPYEFRYPGDMTEGERFAAVVGLLVTDGYAADRSETGYKYAIYQSESKFADLFRGIVPDSWKTASESVTVVNGVSHVEIRLKSREMTDRLFSAGLNPAGGLRNSSTLMPWVLGLSANEIRCFLTSVYLADGSVSNGSTVISCKNPNLVPVIQYAAYRCGRRSNYREYSNKRDSNTRGVVHLTRDRVGTRHLSKETYQSAVWCVTTETGTFTAWGPDGDFSAPYLTGNSTTKPGLTVWSARGDKAIEKRYYVASPGRKLVEFDYSAADARIVAAYSGDREFKKRFDPGVDAHELTGRLVFGDEVYDSDPKHYRQVAKALGHAYAYRAGPKKLAMTSGQPFEVAQQFVSGMEAAYPRVTRWQQRVTQQGEEGHITNDWGRRMPISFMWSERFNQWQSRAYTQAPALLGQSGTREIVVDALIRIARKNIRVITWLVAQVHDALVWDIPIADLEWAIPFIKENMETTFEPSDGSGQAIHFPVEHGEPADDWMAAGH